MPRIIFALAVAFLAAVPGADAADIAVLRPSAVVEADVVRLGDIWEGVGEKADVAIARSPAPGRRAVLDAQWLSEVARGYGIPWRPMSRYNRITVERASRIVDRELIVAEISAALSVQGELPPDAEIEIANGDIRLHLPVDAPMAVAVRDVSFDSRTRRFSAVVETPVERVRLAGMVHTITDVPVLVRTLTKGEVIGEEDVEWRRMRSDRLQRDVVTETSQVVGQAARRTLRAESTLRSADLQRPVVVAKGSFVTMVLQTGALTITAQGRATEDGGDGDVIRIINTQSNLAIEARVEGPNLVSVMPSAHVVVN